MNYAASNGLRINYNDASGNLQLVFSLKQELTEHPNSKLLDKENIISGRWIEVAQQTTRRRSVGLPLELTAEQVMWRDRYGDKSYKKSYVIQQLLLTGLERKQVADLLGIIYQHVRAAAVKIGK